MNVVIVGWLSNWDYPLKDSDFWRHLPEVVKVDFQRTLKLEEIKPNSWILPLREEDIFALSNTHSNHVSLFPSKDAIETCHNKARFRDFLLENGLSQFMPYPISIFSPHIDFPVIHKPVRGKASDGIRISANRLDILVNDVIGRIKSRSLKKRFLIQQYIPGGNEYNLYCVCVAGELIWSVARYRKIKSQIFRPEIDHENDQELELTKDCMEVFRKIFKLLDFSGPACVDFTLIDGLPVIFEVNPRFGGGLFTSANMRDSLIDCLRVILANSTFAGKGR